MWFRRVALAAALSCPLSAHADLRETTVYFGEPALEMQIVDLRAPPEEAPRACPVPVRVERDFGGGRPESFEMALLDCERRPRDEARRALSILARPRNASADAEPQLVPPELLDRVQRLADAFPGHAIEIQSGHRPSSASHSRHHSAAALDLRVAGVPREAVRDLARTFEHTGVGWYPNSTFVHVDVREESTYWVDVSGPGEAPRYVRDEDRNDTAPTEEQLHELRREIEDSLRSALEASAVP